MPPLSPYVDRSQGGLEAAAACFPAPLVPPSQCHPTHCPGLRTVCGTASRVRPMFSLAVHHAESYS